MKKTGKKVFLTILMMAALLGAALQAGCGAEAEAMDSAMEMTTSSVNGMSYVADEMYMEDAVVEESMVEEPMESEMEMTEGGAGNTNQGQTQKLILNIYIDMTVENPSVAMENIISYAQNAGGYLLQSEDYYNEEENTGGAYVIVRIPTGSSPQMEEYLESMGEVTNSRANAQDVTAEYYDLQARIDQGELEIDTLEGLLAECTTVEEILLVRDQLSRVQSDVESMKGRMRVLKELTGYDTIEIYLSPIRNVVNVDDARRIISGSEFTEGLRRGFNNSVRGLVNGSANFVIFLSENIFQLAIFAGIGFGIYLFIRALVRRGRKRRAKRAAQENE